MNSQTVPWLAFVAAIVAAAVAPLIGICLHHEDAKQAREFEIMTERKQALFDALHVIDLVYANESWDGEPPLNQQEWDIDIARSAANKMIIYCGDPKQTVQAFYGAINLHNPRVQQPAHHGTAALEEFRRQVARELSITTFEIVDSANSWISALPGTKEEAEYEKRLRFGRPGTGNEGK